MKKEEIEERQQKERSVTMISKNFFRFCIKREKFFLCFGGYDEKKNQH